MMTAWGAAIGGLVSAVVYLGLMMVANVIIWGVLLPIVIVLLVRRYQRDQCGLP